MNPQHRMIPYPLPSDSQEDMETNRRRNLNYKYPLDIALTQFHLTMVFYDRMRIICTVNQQLVFEDSNDQVIFHSFIFSSSRMRKTIFFKMWCFRLLVNFVD